MAAASVALVVVATRTRRVPLAMETKKAYWWNTPRNRGFMPSSGSAVAGSGLPPALAAATDPTEPAATTQASSV
jgi:hypothetical protein